MIEEKVTRDKMDEIIKFCNFFYSFSKSLKSSIQAIINIKIIFDSTIIQTSARNVRIQLHWNFSCRQEQETVI